MILKVTSIYPVYNQQKQSSQFQYHSTLNKKNSDSFARILESKIKNADQKTIRSN